MINTSFKVKTISGILFIQLALLMFIIWNALIFLDADSKKEFQNRASTTIKLYATISKNAVIAYDLATLKTFATEIMKNPGLVYTRILDNTNRVLIEEGDKAALSRRFTLDTSLEMVNDNVYDIYEYIDESGAVYGKVEIGISTAQLRLAYFNAWKKLLIIGAYELLLSGLLSFLLGSYLVRHLDILKQASEKISAGEFGWQIQVKGNDEISAAAFAFNKMSQNIAEYKQYIQDQNSRLEIQNKNLEIEIVKRQEAESKLRQINDNLEAKVEERTSQLLSRSVELEQKNKALKEAQVQLIQAGKMSAVGQLAGGVSHELNNPLGGILGYSQFILEKKDKYGIGNIPPDVMEKIFNYIKMINDSSIRCKTIVANLLKFSRETKSSALIPIEINQVIADTLNLIRNQLEINEIEIIEHIKPDLPQVNGNPSQLQQAFTNIIINARQAMKSGGRLTIDTGLIQAEDKSFIEIRFMDTGCGIPPENLSKIFEPFFTTKETNEGQGLGLAVSYGIIKDHGGEIKVESQVDKGSVFVVLLPIVLE